MPGSSLQRLFWRASGGIADRQRVGGSGRRQRVGASGPLSDGGSLDSG